MTTMTNTGIWCKMKLIIVKVWRQFYFETRYIQGSRDERETDKGIANARIVKVYIPP